MGPTGLRPMMATIGSTLPVGDNWNYEVKWDGYRALLVKNGPRVQLISRNLKDLSADYPHITAAAARLPQESLILDGKILALDAEGLPSFQALQHRSTKSSAVVFYAFDLLQLGTTDYRLQPLSARRSALRQIVLTPPILLSEPLPGSAAEIEAAVHRAGLEEGRK